MEKDKPELLRRKQLIAKMQLICEQKQQQTSLVYIEINNAIQVARLLQGFLCRTGNNQSLSIPDGLIVRGRRREICQS